MAGPSVSGCVDGEPRAGIGTVQKGQASAGVGQMAVLRVLREAESQAACLQLLLRAGVGLEPLSPVRARKNCYWGSLRYPWTFGIFRDEVGCSLQH